MSRLRDALLSSIVLYAIFALSGAAAILYQLIWQRVLFGIYGTSIESVTIVVTAYLLGLGVGSLAGGRIADRSRSPVLAFAALEVGVGLCGLASVPIFRWVGEATAGAGPASVWGLCLGLLLVPCALMGATLPILTAYAVRTGESLGAGLGGLYAANTAGSAVAALAAAVLLVGVLGQQGTVALAAALNLLAAGAVAGWSRWSRRQ
jgi:spermidine synthase